MKLNILVVLIGEKRVIYLKVVVASTEEQENHIAELVDQIFTEILPKFFPDDKIMELKEQKVLQPQETDQFYNGTLKDAFHIISSLQAVIAVLDLIEDCRHEKEYQEMFERNCQTLNEYGYFFPFSFTQFREAESQIGEFSQFIKPANTWLV
ncbi:hypothetical protein FS935_15785 [Metabacillus litoralis]|uniref:YhcU family protein n=1 Tax=Metabacillus litoralis TaxID=152268 RepID=A0A5C6W273_9BACI|nr:DUF5365 family protein [Metabacillus litoralis]TXC89822.1 hypothetical protein FS935_15785 [Metabacillus litoralis]